MFTFGHLIHLASLCMCLKMDRKGKKTKHFLHSRNRIKKLQDSIGNMLDEQKHIRNEVNTFYKSTLQRECFGHKYSFHEMLKKMHNNSR